MDDATCRRAGGFWIRCAALWLDIAMVWLLVNLGIELCVYCGVYVPFELTLIVCLLVYPAAAIAWRGCTVGKALCGLTVLTSRGESPKWWQGLWRELPCKAVSVLFLGIGFLWLALNARRRAWHDYLAWTRVVQDPRAVVRARILLAFSLVATVGLAGWKAVPFVRECREASQMAAAATAAPMPVSTQPAAPLQITALHGADPKQLAQWIDSHGKDPVDYIIDVAAAHQVTMIGERHHVQDNLVFLNRIIPDLYHRAGVTCIATEVCVAQDNPRLQQLVTAEHFDRDLALQIARNSNWPEWGDKEYWDVFEAVWRLNASLPAGARKMRVVGIDRKLDLPSVSLTGVMDEGTPGPAWERLRVFRIFGELPLLVQRDAIMACNIEREIILPGERGLVWAGAPHSWTWAQLYVGGGKVAGRAYRMGSMLRGKYGGRIFTISLHGSFINDPMIGRPIMNLVESIQTQHDGRPVGFDVPPLSLAALDGSVASGASSQADAEQALPTGGYVYLGPLSRQTRCQWYPGFISPEVFVREKAYFRAEYGHGLKTAQQADAAIASFWQKRGL